MAVRIAESSITIKEGEAQGVCGRAAGEMPGFETNLILLG